MDGMGLNPTGQGMAGAQALVAFQRSDGSMRAYTSPIASYQTRCGKKALFQEIPCNASSSGPNLRSAGTLNLLSGETGSTAGAINPGTKKEIELGDLLPIGAVIARYLKVFPSADPAWFYLHAICQTSAYIIGVAGWAIGLRLGSQSPGVQYTAHSIINIFKGFDILNPEQKWKRAYIGILIGLAIIAATLEIFTWFVVVKRKKSGNTNKTQNGTNLQ
ncbi:hypothetical protein BUALT_Bualt03G0086800 [Buddleja alternifolia]|uniref:Cytochrome b561 domain-containing protein n=1 Tax=Buddleja alternifolia TaxID=168488 RepID=A0AAV6Y2Y3_9LAMI|nr:hypothetical protein BUALT_Bualt03G0086800 [Buddleja alternifolia]